MEKRRRQLAELLREQSYLPVQGICERLNVSEATARRDLAALEREQLVVRTYGGALSEFNSQFSSFTERRGQAVEGKRWIGQVAAGMVADGMTVFMDSGTTVHAIALELARGRGSRQLMVVTNNLPVAERMSAAKHCEVHLLGGQFLARQSVLLGSRALHAVADWSFDLLFLGTEGIDAVGAWNSTTEIVTFQQRAIKCARRVILCVDRSKFGHRAPAKLLSWDEMPELITDACEQDFSAIGIDPAGYQVTAPGELQVLAGEARKP